MNALARMTALLLMILVSLPAMAMTLEEAKAQLDDVKREGLVGEKPTGYLGVVRQGDNAKEIVETINQARRQEYVRIAEKHDIAVTKVESVAGKKAVEKTPQGQYVEIDGNWVKK
ncbi:MAG: YdbL family protein [Marinobacter sp.]|uniref:YdbL family protein n=1 Tax=Marinobacter sp. TaxID=50741 RepID=UPI00299F2865|nr:YdbL family protein [Marinobacter sp.]MDX1633890.1 YdbL family protein [Marinobacter sp.]